MSDLGLVSRSVRILKENDHRLGAMQTLRTAGPFLPRRPLGW